ncbi:MAG: hypothetical protein AAF970_08895 [Bacteroidota bacterium]
MTRLLPACWAAALLLVLGGWPLSPSDYTVAKAVITSEGPDERLLRARVLASDGSVLSENVIKTPFDLEFHEPTFHVRVERAETPAGCDSPFARDRMSEEFKVTYMTRDSAEQGGDGVWVPGAVTGLAGVCTGVDLRVTSDTAETDVYRLEPTP